MPLLLVFAAPKTVFVIESRELAAIGFDLATPAQRARLGFAPYSGLGSLGVMTEEQFSLAFAIRSLAPFIETIQRLENLETQIIGNTCRLVGHKSDSIK